MAFVNRRGGGGDGVGGGGDDQEGPFSTLLRFVELPAVRSSGTLPRVTGVVTAETYASDDELAPLIRDPPPAPAPAPAAPSDQASSSSSAPWWPSFGRVGSVFASWSAPGEHLRAMDIEMGLASFPDYPPSPATSRRQSGRFGEAFRAWFRGRVETDAASSPPRAGTPSSTPLPPTVVDAGAAPGQGIKTDWMKRFKGLLLAYVFFALPLILLFFPRYSKDTNHQILHILVDNSKVGPEKIVVLFLFVAHVTAGVLGVLLAHIADGPKSTKAVGAFTLWIILTVLAFVDYTLWKTLPDESIYMWMFTAHFFVTGTAICWLWCAFVWPSCCCHVKYCCCQGDTRDDRSA